MLTSRNIRPISRITFDQIKTRIYFPDMDFYKLKANIEKGELYKIYFIDGEESFFKDMIVTSLTQVICPDLSFKDFNFDLFEGKLLDLSVFRQAIEQLPIMMSKKLVVVKDADNFVSANRDVLEKLIKVIPESTCLCVVGNKFNQRLKLLKNINSYGGCYFSFYRLRQNESRKFIEREFSINGKSISVPAINLLIEVVNQDVQSLYSEIKKLVLFSGNRAKIDIDDVNRCILSSKEEDVFSLVNAIVEKKGSKAILLLKRKMVDEYQVLPILGLIRWHFKILMKIKILLRDEVSEKEYQKKLGLSPYRIKQFTRQASLYKISSLRKLFHRFNMLSFKLKHSNISKNLLMEALILSLISNNRSINKVFDL